MMAVNFLASLTKALNINASDSSSSSSRSQSFHQFSLLPAELRRKIWSLALPERILEAKLCREADGWHYYSSTPAEKLDARKIPTLFSVNAESRYCCLEEYILFANNYIHPRLDTLYIGWHQDRNRRPVQCKKIEGRSLEKFENVIISGEQVRRMGPSPRFETMIECLKDLGCPASISLGANGGKLPQFLTDLRGYSTATGHQVILLNWTTDFTIHEDSTPRKNIQELVIDAFRLEEQSVPGLRLPKVSNKLIYVYSGP